MLSRNHYEQIIDESRFKKGGGRNRQSHYNKHNNHNHGRQQNDFSKGSMVGSMVKRGSHRHSKHNNGGGLVRNVVSESIKVMQGQVGKWKTLIQNADTESTKLQATSLFNKATPDNFKKIAEGISKLHLKLYGALRELTPETPEYEAQHEECMIFVRVFYKKATLEDKYCSMNTNIFRYVLEQEHEKFEKEAENSSRKGKESQSKTKKMSKTSKFRTDMIEECKSTLSEFSQEMVITGETEIDRDDAEYKYKKRLKGNLNFIAELFKKKIVSKPVPMYVLQILLGMYEDETAFNNFTLDGACMFLGKVGAKLEKLTAKPKKGDESSKNEYSEKFEAIVKRLEFFEQDENTEQRIRLLIKNRLDLRSNGWVDKDSHDGPKTKSQIKKEHLAELNGEELSDPKYNKSKSFKASRSSNSTKDISKSDFALKMGRMQSTTSVISEVTEDNEEAKAPPKEYSPRELEHMDHEAIKDKLIGNFSEYLNTNKLETQVFIDESKHLSGGMMLNHMLFKLYDKEDSEVQKFNDFFVLLNNAKLAPNAAAKHNKGHSGHLFGKKEIEEGISKFFLILPNIESDLPKLAAQFSELLYFIFIEKNLADFSRVEIKLESDEELEDGEEPIYMIDIYIKILAALLTKIEDRLGDAKMEHYYEHFKIAKSIDLLRPHGMGDYTDEETTISEKILEKFNLDS